MTPENNTIEPIDLFTKEITKNLGIRPENTNGFLACLNFWLSDKLSPDLLQTLPQLTTQYNEQISTLVHQLGEDMNQDNLLQLKNFISDSLSDPDPKKTELNRIAILLTLFQQIFTHADHPNSNYLDNLKRLVQTISPRELAKIKIIVVNSTSADLKELYLALFKSHTLRAEPRTPTSQEKTALELSSLDFTEVDPFPLPTYAGTTIHPTTIPW